MVALDLESYQNHEHFKEDEVDAQSRFALVILDRDAAGSPLRKYSAVNIQAFDLQGDGFDPQNTVSYAYAKRAG